MGTKELLEQKEIRLPKGKLSKSQKKLLANLYRTKKPVTLGLHRIVDGDDEKINISTFRACLKKRYLIGEFDDMYIPTWHLHPDIPSHIINEIVASVALGIIR